MMKQLVLASTLLISGLTFAQLPTGSAIFNSSQAIPGMPAGSVINLGDLDIHFRVPIRHKEGLTPFVADWNYDSDLWYLGVYGGSSNTWIVTRTGGYTENNQVQPATYSTTAPLCNLGDHSAKSFQYVDETGATHTFNTEIYYPPYHTTSCYYPSSVSNLADSQGLGYLLTASINSSGVVTSTVTRPDGATVSSSKIFTDRNGNKITFANNTYTDTLGVTALTQSGPGTDYSYAYTGAGGSEPITVAYSGLSLFSAFDPGCSGTSESAPGVYYYPNKFTYVDNSYFSLGWETSPGHAGYYTGRVASVRVPTGGTISFNYNGANHGMNCDGTGSGFTMTTPDSATPWTFTHTNIGSNGQSTTTVIDPAGNKTVYTFLNTAYFGLLELQKLVYTWNASTQTFSLVATVNTSYNGGQTSFTVINNVTQVYIDAVSNYQNKRISYYTSDERLAEEDDYGWGTGAPQAAPFRKIGYQYGSFQPSGGCAALGNNLLDDLCAVQIFNGSNTLQQQTAYNRDVHGNVLGRYVLFTGSNTNLTSTYTYNANGTVATMTDVNGDQYSYTYGDCSGTLPTLISEPATLSKSMSWDCNGAVPLSLTNEAGVTINSVYSGQYFWRLNTLTNQTTGAVTNFSYTPNSVQTWKAPTGTSVSSFLNTFDSLGRVHVVQQENGPSSTTWDSTETDYNSVGEVSRVTQPYNAGAGVTNASAPATTYTYDGAGRVISMASTGASTTSISYWGNQVNKAVNGQPTGENPKKWEYTYDSIGRLAAVCEITGATGDPSCSDGTGPGYQTWYTYDAAGRLTQVQQNSTGTMQTRTFTYDLAGRLTQESNPETSNSGANGTTTYSYDTATPGELYQVTNNNGDTLTYTYGAMHRILTINLNNGVACKNFLYDTAHAMTGAHYVNGRLANATTDDCLGNMITNESFGYDSDGRETDLWESTPHSAGTYHITAGYYSNGAINTLSGTNLPTITYNLDSEGRLYSVLAALGTSPVEKTLYNTASQVTTVSLGSGDSDTYTYDSNTGAIQSYAFNIGASSATGTLTWNGNGTVQQLAITDPFNVSNGQTCNYTYDGIARLTKADCGTVWGQTFSYDAFGNLSKQLISGDGGMAFNPGYTVSNQYLISGAQYDANGNLTNDSLHNYVWSSLFSGPAKIDGNALTYDAFNRLVENQNGNGYVEYMYSPFGNKLSVMAGQTATRTLITLPAGAVAAYAGTSLQYYWHADWLGSLRLGSTPTRTTTWDLAYAPFGEQYATSGSPSTQAFTEQLENKVEANLWDFPMREYFSNQGRWMSPDPAGLAAVDPMSPQTWNRYAYVGGNPMSNVDPLGLCMFGLSRGFCDAIRNMGDTIGGIYSAILGGSAVQEYQFVADIQLAEVQALFYPSGIPLDASVTGGTSTLYDGYLQPTGVDIIGASNGGESGGPGGTANNASADPTLDNRANALAQAINRTGVQSVQNPCFVAGFYAASATAATVGAASQLTTTSAVAPSFVSAGTGGGAAFPAFSEGLASLGPTVATATGWLARTRQLGQKAAGFVVSTTVNGLNSICQSF